jgi:signal recognition particle subunit SRP19
MAAAAVHSGISAARSWNPNFKHSDRERWICIYTAYINSKKTLAEGRRVAKNKAVENPTPQEIRDVVAQAGLELGVENKIYPREVDRNARGRIRVQLRNDDGTPVLPQFPSRQAVLEYLCEMIPKLKSRSQSGVSSQQQSGAGGGTSGKKGKGGKKK